MENRNTDIENDEMQDLEDDEDEIKKIYSLNFQISEVIDPLHEYGSPFLHRQYEICNSKKDVADTLDIIYKNAKRFVKDKLESDFHESKNDNNHKQSPYYT